MKKLLHSYQAVVLIVLLLLNLLQLLWTPSESIRILFSIVYLYLVPGWALHSWIFANERSHVERIVGGFFLMLIINDVGLFYLNLLGVAFTELTINVFMLLLYCFLIFHFANPSFRQKKPYAKKDS